MSSLLSNPSIEFGLQLLQQINRNECNNNTLISPISVLLSYGMLLEGADGRTKENIMESLRLSSIAKESSDIIKASKMLLEGYLLAEKSADCERYSFTIGNLLMVNSKFVLKDSYQQNVRENFLAEALDDDFSDGRLLMKKINSWVAQKTKDKIKNILESPPSPEAIMLLVNAVHFKGNWFKEFPKKSTEDKIFKNSDGTKSKASMMNLRRQSFNFAKRSDKSLKIIELPFFGEICMIIILPNSSTGLADLTRKLNSVTLIDLIDSMQYQQINHLSIPKFKLENSHPLHQILPQMGMALPFCDSAQFEGIADGVSLRITESLQKTLIEVDEEGCEAAAVTIIPVTGCCFTTETPNETFIVDKPFLFIIRDKTSGINLFIGQINKM